jgi:putative hydrolase of the HAD superfamily
MIRSRFAWHRRDIRPIQKERVLPEQRGGQDRVTWISPPLDSGVRLVFKARLSSPPLMEALIFDFGDTLVEYEGVPLSWVDHYPEALGRLASFLGTTPDSNQFESACAILRSYNTRLNPRDWEIGFSQILSEICGCFLVPATEDCEGAARVFFSLFRQRLRSFPDARNTLAVIRGRGLKIGVFTDVPYGMPRALVLEDVDDAGLGGLFDLLVTSVDVGFRKPAPITLAYVADRIGTNRTGLAYIGNERKDIGAAKQFGCTAILLDRSLRRPEWGQDRTIALLTELLEIQEARRV